MFQSQGTDDRNTEAEAILQRALEKERAMRESFAKEKLEHQQKQRQIQNQNMIGGSNAIFVSQTNSMQQRGDDHQFQPQQLKLKSS